MLSELEEIIATYKKHYSEDELVEDDTRTKLIDEILHKVLEWDEPSISVPQLSPCSSLQVRFLEISTSRSSHAPPSPSRTWRPQRIPGCSRAGKLPWPPYLSSD